MKYIVLVPIIIEWLCFACIQQQQRSSYCTSSHWKAEAVTPPPPSRDADRVPWLVRRIFSNNFKNWYGILAIGSSFLLPLELYYESTISTKKKIPIYRILLLGSLIFGRILCGYVEIWLIRKHICQSLLVQTSSA